MKRKLLYFFIFIITISILTGCSSAGSYYSKGKKAFRKGDYEEAANTFTMAIAKNPNRAEYYIDYGMCLIELKQYEEAQSQFDQAYLEKDIKLIRRNNKRALRGKGIAYYRQNQYKKAIEQFELALEISELPKLSMDILYYKASALKHLDSYDQAVEAYTMLLELDPRSSEALSERGFCYRILGEYENGLEDYNQAIALDESNYSYYFGKYHLLKDYGRDKEANELLEEATAIEAKTDEQLYQQAKLQYYLGNDEIAYNDFMEYYQKGFLEASYYIGELHLKNKDYRQAIASYEGYLQETRTPNSIIYNQLGVCYLKLGEYQQALSLFQKGIELQDQATLQVLCKNEIIAFENMGLFDQARESLEVYLKRYPDDAMAVREGVFLETRLTKEAITAP